MSDIGAPPSGRWQFWQLRCRIGATSFVNVTSWLAASCAAAGSGAASSNAPAAAKSPDHTRLELRRFVIEQPPRSIAPSKRRQTPAAD